MAGRSPGVARRPPGRRRRRPPRRRRAAPGAAVGHCPAGPDDGRDGVAQGIGAGDRLRGRHLRRPRRRRPGPGADPDRHRCRPWVDDPARRRATPGRARAMPVSRCPGSPTRWRGTDSSSETWPAPSIGCSRQALPTCARRSCSSGLTRRSMSPPASSTDGSADDRTRLESGGRGAGDRRRLVRAARRLRAAAEPRSQRPPSGQRARQRRRHAVLRLGDAVVAHPFAALLVPLRIVAQPARVRGRRRSAGAGVRDAYLAGFATAATPRGPGGDARRRRAPGQRRPRPHVGARRSAARAQGVAIDDEWARAALETLLAVLDPASS